MTLRDQCVVIRKASFVGDAKVTFLERDPKHKQKHHPDQDLSRRKPHFSFSSLLLRLLIAAVEPFVLFGRRCVGEGSIAISFVHQVLQE
jgi:hypothetical protein